MKLFSRRKRLLNRTPKVPKMSSRRQFHRALRRHPAWPLVMAEAAARAQRAREAAQRDRTNVVMMVQGSGRTQIRKALRRNRAGVIALIVAGALVALLNGIGAAHHGTWTNNDIPFVTGQAPARFGAATAYDDTNKQMLVFGGFSGAQPPGGTPAPPTRGDTWGFGAGKWFNRNPVHAPSPRGFSSMTWDDARKNVVLFGGAPYRSNSVSDETWTWDGSDWALMNPPEPRPPARQNSSMVYDAHRKVVVMFGGRGADDLPLDDTWTWDGSTWKLAKTPVKPFPPRHSAAMAYDLCRGEAVMFGGSSERTLALVSASLDPAPGETWTWDGIKWTPRNPVPAPTRRIGASMTYSPVTGRVLLYGGLFVPDAGPGFTASSRVATDENVWMWDGTGWEKETYEDAVGTAALLQNAGFLTHFLGVPPPPRAYASFVLESVNGKSELFGGTPADPGQGLPQVALSDHWIFQENSAFTGFAEAVARGGPRRCANPVPIPSDGGSIGGDGGVQPSRVETRDEIKEIARLPVLLGTVRNPYKDGSFPGRTDQPPCIRGKDEDLVKNTHLATDPKRNRIYQFYMCQNGTLVPGPIPPGSPTVGPGTRKVLIQAYDAKTLKPLGSALAPMPTLDREIEFGAGNVLHDVDRGRFLILGDKLYVIQQDLIEKGANPIVGAIPSPGATLSFFNHPKTGRAKLLFTGPNSVGQFDLDDSRQDWSRTLDGCTNANSNSVGVQFKQVRIQNRVYASCVTQSSSGNTQNAVVRIPISENTDGSETAGTPEIFPGPANIKRTWADPQAERMLLLSETAEGATLWVFDGQTSHYVGRSGMVASSSGFGFDQESGRFYALTPDYTKGNFRTGKAQGGLLVLDTRLTPVPQAQNFTQFMYPSEAELGILPPQDGLPRRVFLRRAAGYTPSDPNDEKQAKANADGVFKYPDGENVRVPDEMHYKVLVDLLPVPEQPGIGQLDALTIPVAESAGKTEISFEAEGSGYGIRLRSVGGIWSALRPPQQSGQTGALDGTSGNEFAPPCFSPDRELMAGWVLQARLSDLETSARTSGLEVDSSSKSDLMGPVTRCLSPGVSPTLAPGSARAVAAALWPLLPLTQLEGAAGPNLAWDKHFKEVECVGDSSATNKTTLSDVYGSATCKQKEARVEGISRGALAGSVPSGYSVTNTMNSSLVGSPVDYSVGEGTSNVVVARDSVKGVVVTSTAEAKGIKLPGITIGYVKTEAVAWSNGRPGEGRASFTRTICRVQIALFEQQQPYKDNACLTPSQQNELVNNWNSRWGVNSKMTLPVPDADFFKGSPGGYIAGVMKPLVDEIEDGFFNRDVQKEVPGLQLVFIKDSPGQGPGRQVLQLAAVRAVAGFGVQCGSEFVYSPSAKDCVALTFEDGPVEFEDEFVDEGELSSSDETEFDSEGGWTPLEATGPPEGLALGQRIGRFIETLPIIRQLPIRQMGEALLAGSVWLLLALPLALASRRFAMNLAKRS